MKLVMKEIGDTPIFRTGLYRRIINQEFLVGTDKKGNDPATGLFLKIEDTSNYVGRISRLIL